MTENVSANLQLNAMLQVSSFQANNFVGRFLVKKGVPLWMTVIPSPRHNVFVPNPNQWKTHVKPWLSPCSTPQIYVTSTAFPPQKLIGCDTSRHSDLSLRIDLGYDAVPHNFERIKGSTGVPK